MTHICVSKLGHHGPHNGLWLIRPSHHDDVIKWKYFPRYWPFVRGIHWSPVNYPHKSQWRGALKFSLICARINGWVNNRESGDLRRHRAHYDVIVMIIWTNAGLLLVGHLPIHVSEIWIKIKQISLKKMHVTMTVATSLAILAECQL